MLTLDYIPNFFPRLNHQTLCIFAQNSWILIHNYKQAMDYLYRNLPMFQRQGAAAMKKDLTNIRLLLEAMGNPHKQFKSIHVGGTNGKGSASHMLSAMFQSQGYRVGVYTSPHYKDFRERIKINSVEKVQLIP
jgi:dihydrofolate synthase/folylpolyglutamate synthase